MEEEIAVVEPHEASPEQRGLMCMTLACTPSVGGESLRFAAPTSTR